MAARKLSPAEEIAAVEREAKYFTLDERPTAWLDTGSPALNAVLGSPEKGLAVGRILELFGPASHGKTMLALFLARRMQQAGGIVVWMDFENTFDAEWARSQGVDPDAVYVLRPALGRFGKETGELRMQTAEELFKVMEELTKRIHKRDGAANLMVVVDSVAAILVEDEQEAGVDGQNMYTTQSLPKFLGKTLRRWVSRLPQYGGIAVLVNQVRTKPGVAFGNPEYTPGGRALEYYAHVRAEVRRGAKGGRLLSLGRIAGLRGRITNKKNKAGDGSREGLDCGYVCRFRDGSWEFPTVKEAASDDYAKVD